MKRIALFRTPMSRGMLGGALAGCVLLLHVWISRTFFPSYTTGFFYYTIARVLLEITFLFMIPAIFGHKRPRFLFALQLGVMFFVFLVFVGAYGLVPLIIEQVGFVQIISTAYNSVYLLICGALVGLANAYVCNQPKLRLAGLKWGALGSLFSIAAHVSYDFLFQSGGAETSALFSILIAIGRAVQGVLAAVPFERTVSAKDNFR